MELGASSGELAFLASMLLAGGLVTGFLAGLLGIGGGGILVPVLYETFSALGVAESIRMHVVLGTSFAVIAPTAWRSSRAHLATGAVDREALARLGPYVVAGVIVGAALVSAASGTALKLVWIVCGGFLATKMALGRDDWRLGDELPKSRLLEATAFAIGLVSTLMSIGGGMFLTTVFMLYGRPIHSAVATSSAFGPLIAIPGLLGYVWAGWGVPGLPALSVGYVSLVGAALIIPASVLAAPYGVRAAHGISKRKLELAFAGFLAFVAVRLLISLL
jgi:uncharacterized membrane protein YfcA